jgi:acrylyl-CoA reductase (NADPH)
MMTQETFKAMVLEQNDGETLASIQTLNLGDLPDEEILVAVDYSSLNYKDGLAVTGRGKVISTWPMVPGIDLSGTVLESDSGDYAAGDKVVLTGWGVGEKHWGGYSQRQRVKAEWLAPLPSGLDTRQAMAIGTAGFTAMLCVMALEEGGLTPEKGKVLVTGASGGVGSVAIALLAHAGYEVAAVTGRESSHDYLRELGASEIVTRDEMSERSRPLEKQRWAGVIDTVGGAILARALAETHYGGAVAACGLAGDYKLPSTVMPFILRGVRLQGVDSVMCPAERRATAWRRLAEELPSEMLGAINQVVSLEEVPRLAGEIIDGQIKGRVVVDLNA